MQRYAKNSIKQNYVRKMCKIAHFSMEKCVNNHIFIIKQGRAKLGRDPVFGVMCVFLV